MHALTTSLLWPVTATCGQQVSPSLPIGHAYFTACTVAPLKLLRSTETLYASLPSLRGAPVQMVSYGLAGAFLLSTTGFRALPLCCRAVRVRASASSLASR
jgi:hypothetical protein